ncbi:MAG: DNA polymerase III subunit gamma/tau C-terminal domain-containing protein, partial [Pseudomonas sp.]
APVTEAPRVPAGVANPAPAPSAPQSAPPRAAANDVPPWATDDHPVAAPVAPPSRPAMPEMAMVPPPAPYPAPAPPVHAPVAAPATADAIADAEHWLELVARSGLNGPSRQLAANAAFVSHQGGVLRLALASGFEYLQSERAVGDLAEALATRLGSAPRILIETGAAAAETLHERAHRQQGERQGAAEQAFMNDPSVQQLIQQHGARVVPDSIRPYDE